MQHFSLHIACCILILLLLRPTFAQGAHLTLIYSNLGSSRLSRFYSPPLSRLGRAARSRHTSGGSPTGPEADDDDGGVGGATLSSLSQLSLPPFSIHYFTDYIEK